MFKDKVYRVREFINIRLYEHKVYVIRFLHTLSFIVSLIAIAAIIYQHGFPKTSYNLNITESIIEFSLIFYVIKFLIRTFYEFHPIDFIKENKFEAILLSLIAFDQIFNFFTGVQVVRHFIKAIGFPGIHIYYNLFYKYFCWAK